MASLNRVTQFTQQMVQSFKLIHAKKGLNCFTNSRNYSNGVIAAVLVHCAANKENKLTSIEYPDSSRLSHEQLIQQACTATVNSTCELLTCTLVALADIGQKYRKALEDQMSLMEESLTHIENDALQDELTDLTTVARSNVDTFRRNFLALDSLMDYVEKLVISATETSYLAGAETACTVLSERLHSAKTMVNENKHLIKKLEEELVHLQQVIIKKSCTVNDDDKKITS